MRAGWFVIPGVQPGERSLEEQIKGLADALARCAGKTVLDLGCAEGLIALEFVKAGAASVYACDCNVEAIDAARVAGAALNEEQRGRVGFHVRNINDLVEDELGSRPVWSHDIVLALAVLHKMHDPARATRYVAKATRERLVVRLPQKSTGVIQSKWGDHPVCDTGAVFRKEGLRLESQQRGPRGELVQHWVR